MSGQEPDVRGASRVAANTNTTNLAREPGDMLIGVEESVWRRRIRSGCEVGRAATDEANQGRAALRVKRFLAALAS